MVVVPTSHEVTLTYGTTGANVLGDGCTVVGLGVVVAMAALWWRRRRTGPDTAAGASGGLRRPGGAPGGPSLTLSSQPAHVSPIPLGQARGRAPGAAGGDVGRGGEVP